MGELLTTVPGDIPGLLRRGSPVVTPDGNGDWTVTDPPTPAGLLWIAKPGSFRASREAFTRDLQLDLTDPTGRAHAAWWANERAQLHLRPSDPGGTDEAAMLAMLGWTMTSEQIDALARLVLRSAGRTA